MKHRTVLFSVVLMAVIGIFLGGCASTPSGSSAPSQSDLLAQAGFKAHTPQSPQKVAMVNTLPAKKVVLNKYNKPLYLVCPNPDSKQCFLGDQAAYDRYQQMAIQNAISEDQHKVSEERTDPEFWDMWVDSQGGG